MKFLASLSLSETLDLASSYGFPKFRGKQVFEAINNGKKLSESTNIPKNIQEKMLSEYSDDPINVVETREGKNGVKKYLFQFLDGNIVEAVYLPNNYGNTVCISTQVGCRMGCVFCRSGIGGLVRSLEPGEMLSEVLLLNRLNGGTMAKRCISNIVLMGSGEPLDNYDNVMKFLSLVTSPEGINFSPRNISLSTVGLPEKIIELANSPYKVTLSLSLHAPTDEKRKRLIPMAHKYSVNDIIEAVKKHIEITGRRAIIEYALVEGENSTKESAEELSKLLKGINCHINLIPLNYVKEKGLKSARTNIVEEFLNILNKEKISATVRRSLGSDIEGACGQLRNTFVETNLTRS